MYQELFQEIRIQWYKKKKKRVSVLMEFPTQWLRKPLWLELA